MPQRLRSRRARVALATLVLAAVPSIAASPAQAAPPRPTAIAGTTAGPGQPIAVTASLTTGRRQGTPATTGRVLLVGGAIGSGRRYTIGTLAIPALTRRQRATLTATFPARRLLPGAYRLALCVGEKPAAGVGPVCVTGKVTVLTVPIAPLSETQPPVASPQPSATPAVAGTPSASPTPSATPTATVTPTPTPAPTPAPAELEIAPDPIDLGTLVTSALFPGQAADAPGAPTTFKLLTVRNQGGQPAQGLELKSTAPGEFLVAPGGGTPCGATLAVGASCTALVTFRPAAYGERTANLAVGADGLAPLTVALRGKALSPVRLALTSGAPDTAFAFGKVPTGYPSSLDDTFTRSVEIANVGDFPTSQLTLTPTGADSDFAIVSDGCTGAILAPGGTCTLKVRARGTLGARTATLTFASDAATLALSLGAEGVDPAALTLTPTTKDLGDRYAGEPAATQTFTAKNTGALPAAGLSVALTGATTTGFTVGADTCTGTTLAPGDTCTVEVSHAVASDFAGPSTARSVGLALSSTSYTSAIDTATITATDHGPRSPAELSFASSGPAVTTTSLTGGTITSRNDVLPRVSVKVYNRGTTASAVPTVSVSPNFNVDTSSCTAALADGASCTVTVVPEASILPDRGDVEGSVTIALAGGSSVTATVLVLSRLLPAPVLTMQPASLDFGTAAPTATTASKTVTIRNASGVAAAEGLSFTFSGASRFHYTVVDNGCGDRLDPGAACTVEVAFTPDGVDTMTLVDVPASLDVATTTPDGVGDSVALTAKVRPWDIRASLTASATTLHLGGTLTHTLKNIGTEPIRLRRWDRDGFWGLSEDVSGCLGVLLAPGAQCQVVYKLEPSPQSDDPYDTIGVEYEFAGQDYTGTFMLKTDFEATLEN